MHLYKVVFRRLPPMEAGMVTKVKSFITFGEDEQDAVKRVWEAYAGSSFHREFSPDAAIADFVFGGIFKIGG